MIDMLIQGINVYHAPLGNTELFQMLLNFSQLSSTLLTKSENVNELFYFRLNYYTIPYKPIPL